MGSSYVAGFNSKSFSNNWTKFDRGGQNIYESYRFLKHHVEKTVIDTILLGINTFDLRDTIYKDFVNGNSFAFGIDYTNWGILKSKIQSKKDDVFRLRFPNKLDLNSNITKINPKYSLPYLDDQIDLFAVDGVPLQSYNIF